MEVNYVHVCKHCTYQGTLEEYKEIKYPSRSTKKPELPKYSAKEHRYMLGYSAKIKLPCYDTIRLGKAQSNETFQRTKRKRRQSIVPLVPRRKKV